jgi:DNA-binding MarR family transcriptional regulator
VLTGPDQKPDSPTLKKRHNACIEEEFHSQHVTVEGLCCFLIVDGKRDLADLVQVHCPNAAFHDRLSISLAELMIYNGARREQMSSEARMRPEQTAEQIHSAAIHLLRRLRQVDAASGLNSPRLSALSVIVFAGPLTLGQLADAEQVKPPTMTRIVHALEAKGLVRKIANPEDRRTIHLAATMKGKRLLLAARRRRIGPLADGIGRLSHGEQETLHTAMAILLGLVREL